MIKLKYLKIEYILLGIFLTISIIAVLNQNPIFEILPVIVLLNILILFIVFNNCDITNFVLYRTKNYNEKIMISFIRLFHISYEYILTILFISLFSFLFVDLVLEGIYSILINITLIYILIIFLFACFSQIIDKNILFIILLTTISFIQILQIFIIDIANASIFYLSNDNPLRIIVYIISLIIIYVIGRILLRNE